MERSPAFERNKDPILDALRKTRLAECERILELASGPGEHAPFFAQQLGEASPVFQPTDSNTELLASSDAHAEAAGLLGSKVLRAKFLEVSEADWDVDDAAFDGCLAIDATPRPHSSHERRPHANGKAKGAATTPSASASSSSKKNGAAPVAVAPVAVAPTTFKNNLLFELD
mmetsp:Transcript_17404/g.53025  ORF Transcript_17404/g.53025 Transcript_17404/m.53025 type:complete len:172 (+) Transcript_17404:1321-1836(+)